MRLRKDLIAIVLTNEIHIYDLQLFKRLPDDKGTIKTIENKLGLGALCPDSDNSVLACPDVVRGHIRIER